MSTPRFSYAAIEPLIAQRRREGRSVVASFKCPETGESVASRAFLHESLKGRGVEEVRKVATEAVHIHLAGHVARTLGYGFAGNMGRAVVRETARQTLPLKRDKLYTDEDIERGYIEAFRIVSDHFTWNGSEWRWAQGATATRPAPAATTPAPRSTPPPVRSAPRATNPAVDPAFQARPAVTGGTPFAAVIRAASFDDPQERELFARMLAEVAAADGAISDEERALMASFTEAGLALDAATDAPPLTESDLAEADVAEAEAMMLVTLAVAYADASMHEAEAGRLEVYRAGLGISSTRQGELDQLAREHVVSELYGLAWVQGRMDMNARNNARRAGMRLGLAAPRLADLDREARQRMTS